MPELFPYKTPSKKSLICSFVSTPPKIRTLSTNIYLYLYTTNHIFLAISYLYKELEYTIMLLKHQKYTELIFKLVTI